jgi:hypothetical protein
MGFTDTRKLAMLDNELGNGSPATLFLGWFVTYPADAGTGGVEPSTGGYARSSGITNNSTNFPNAAMSGSTAEKKLATSTSFSASTGAQGTIAGFGLWDASSAGNLRAFAKPYGPAKVCTVVAATDLFTSAGHGLTADQVVRFEADNGSLPAGLVANTTTTSSRAASPRTTSRCRRRWAAPRST